MTTPSSQKPSSDDGLNFILDALGALLLSMFAWWVQATLEQYLMEWLFLTFAPFFLVTNGVRQTARGLKNHTFNRSALLRVTSGIWLVALILSARWASDFAGGYGIWPYVAAAVMVAITLVIVAAHWIASRALRYSTGEYVAGISREPKAEIGTSTNAAIDSNRNPPLWVLGIIALVLVLNFAFERIGSSINESIHRDKRCNHPDFHACKAPVEAQVSNALDAEESSVLENP